MKNIEINVHEAPINNARRGVITLNRITTMNTTDIWRTERPGREIYMLN